VKNFSGEKVTLKNHVFTTICPQKTIQKPRSAHQNLRNPFEKHRKTRSHHALKKSYL